MNGTETGSRADPTIPKVGAKDRDESARLVALRRYDVLDTPPEYRSTISRRLRLVSAMRRSH